MPQDATAIAEIRVAGWQTTYRGQLDDERLDQMSPAADAVRWREHLMTLPERHRVYVAERDGDVVGFASCGPSRASDDGPGVAEVYAIYVRPQAMRAGIGGALMREAMRVLRDDGYRDVVLWVLESNAAAHRFYEAQGFRREAGVKEDTLDGFAVREVRYRSSLER